MDGDILTPGRPYEFGEAIRAYLKTNELSPEEFLEEIYPVVRSNPSAMERNLANLQALLDDPGQVLNSHGVPNRFARRIARAINFPYSSLMDKSKYLKAGNMPAPQ